MWRDVTEHLENADCLGTGFPVSCYRHFDTVEFVSEPGKLPLFAPDGPSLPNQLPTIIFISVQEAVFSLVTFVLNVDMFVITRCVHLSAPRPVYPLKRHHSVTQMIPNTSLFHALSHAAASALGCIHVTRNALTTAENAGFWLGTLNYLVVMQFHRLNGQYSAEAYLPNLTSSF